MSTGTFIDDFVSNAIDIAIATIGSEGEGQERDAPQVMVTYATRTTNNSSLFWPLLSPFRLLQPLQHSLNFLFFLWV